MKKGRSRVSKKVKVQSEEHIQEQALRERLLEGLNFDAVGEVREERISETLKDNYMPYAMSVIVSRAIPEIDGLKPSHRKLLYTMYKMGLFSQKRTKSANVVGQTMKLNPHGDMAIYETMVRLTRGNEALLHPYIDSKGNFGKQYSRDMAFAASRYTEVRLDDFAKELFRGIDMNVVDFMPNYDGTMLEPKLLPAAYPAILVNPNQGIAVGMASNIASFNLGELCQACRALIKEPELSISDILKIMPAPDFPSAASLIYHEGEMETIYKTGRGSFRLRANYKIDTKAHIIEITEIPYTSTVEAIVDEIAKHVKANKLKEITDVRDETDLKGLKIAIDYKRSVDPEALMQKLFKITPLESRFSCNFNVLLNGRPQVLGVSDLLLAWLDFRRSCIRREKQFLLNKRQGERHLLLALQKILLDIDMAVKIVRETEKESEVVPRLMEAFLIDERQAEFVAEIKLRQLNREHLIKKTEQIESLEKEIADLEALLSSNRKLDTYLSKDLERIEKLYARPRQTQLVHESETTTLTKEDLIEDFRLKCFLTRDGYLKKIALTSLRSAGDLKLKEDDAIIAELDAENKAELLLFSSESALYKLQLYEVPDDKPSDWGSYLPTLLGLSENERILYILKAGDYSGEMIFAYKNGRVSRVPLASYITKQKRKKLVGACASFPIAGILYRPNSDNCSEDALSVPRTVFVQTEESTVEDNKLMYEDIALITTQDRCVLFSVDLIGEKASRSNQGDQVLRLKKSYEVKTLLYAKDLPFDEAGGRYRSRKLPCSGTIIKETTLEGRQITLTDLV